MLTRVSIFATVAVLAAPAHTATINTIYRLNGNLATNTPNCPGLSLDVGLGTTTCTDSGNENNNLYMTEMAARADPLSFGVRASTSVVGDSSGGFIGGSSVGGTVSHNFLDTVFFPTTSGTWLLPIDVAGSLSVNKPPLGPSGGGGDVIAALNVSVTAGPTVTTIYDRWLQASTGPSDILDTVTGSLGTTVLALDLTTANSICS